MSTTSPSDRAPQDREPSIAGEESPSQPVPETVVIESDVSLSKSLIWRRQREQYGLRGLESWTADMVPNYQTNNPFIAEMYAKVAFAYLSDCLLLTSGESPEPPSPQRPLRILELGSGPGKFAYLFLRQLTGLMRVEGIPVKTVRYCMTDCAKSLLEGWRRNTYLVEFIELGALQFDLLQVGEEITSQFVIGANPATGAQSYGPLLVIANYVFDSLPQDAFAIQDGRLSESLVTTRAPSTKTGKAQTELLSALQLSFTNVGLSRGPYPDQTWNQVLERYRNRLANATVLFPSEALKILQELRKFTDGRMLVLAADKGLAHEDQLSLYPGPPTIEFHAANCFSQIVNLDAMAKVFTAAGGDALLPEKHSSSLSICGFLHHHSEDSFSATKKAYEETQQAFAPDDLFDLLSWLNAHMEEMSVPQILAMLRLTRWDPVALMRVFPVLARQTRNVSSKRHDLREAVLRTWANDYPVSPGETALAFDCGVILLELKFFEDAEGMFKRSQQILGPSAATSYNLGLCAQGQRRPSEALRMAVEACNLDPEFAPARALRQKLEQAGNSDRAKE